MNWLQSLAASYEAEYGALPDPVSTGGSHLVSRPPTPTLPASYHHDGDFVKVLDRKLELLLFRQGLRCQLYGRKDADDSPISHTPPEVRERFHIDQEMAMKELESQTPDEDDYIMINTAHPGKVEVLTPDSDTNFDATNVVVQAYAKVPTQVLTHGPHTPPLSSGEHSPQSTLACSMVSSSFGKMSDNSLRGKKRSFAHVERASPDRRPCQRRRLMKPSRTTMVS